MLKDFDINKYMKVKNEVKQMYLNEKLGNQQSYETQAKLFGPLIDTTRDTAKNLEKTIVDDRQNLSNVLASVTRQLMRANDERDALEGLPFHYSDIREESHRESTPKKDRPIVVVNLDKDL